MRRGGAEGGGLKTDHFEALPQLILVALAVDFEADVLCGLGDGGLRFSPGREWRVK